MIIPVGEYLSFLVGMYAAGMTKEVEEALLMQKSVRAARTIELTPTPKLYEVFGHIKDVNDLSEALKNQKGGMVVDGTKPIKIGSHTRILGRYDTAVTPVLQRIVDAVNAKVGTKAWEITFTFEKPTTLIKCTTHATLFNRPVATSTSALGGITSGATVAPRQEVRGITFGPTVKDCIEASEGIILDVLK